MTNKTVYSHMLNYFYFIEIFDMWENDLRFFLHRYLHEATQSFTAFTIYLNAHHFISLSQFVSALLTFSISSRFYNDFFNPIPQMSHMWRKLVKNDVTDQNYWNQHCTE